jgi:TonB-linked SusC/RagA family outer membrane protein
VCSSDLSVIASISTVNVKDLKVPSSNLTAAFAGRIAGMISYQTSGEPGADNAQFFVRGVTTFGYKKDPLILIDGFESNTDALARLSVDDIESFSIMKDATATVLYGARGANGIIIITTKAGREGPAKVNVRIETDVATPTRMVEMLDGVSYMKLYNQAQISRNPKAGTYYSEQKIQSTARGENPMFFPNVDWYDELFNKSTVNKKATLNISGGGAVANYFVSGGYENENGLLKVDKRNNFNNNINIDRFNLRSNVIFKLTKTTTLDTRLSGRYERYTGPYVSAGSIFNMVMDGNPVDFPAIYEPDEANLYTKHVLFGNSTSMKANPYAEMVRGYEDRASSNFSFAMSLSQDLKMITEGLKFMAQGSLSAYSAYSSRRNYSPFYYTLESYNQITGDFTLFPLNPTSGWAYLGDVVPGRDANSSYTVEARLTWDREFGKHALSAMTVGLMQETLPMGGNNTSIYWTLPERNLNNAGRFTYGYDIRYFFEFAYGYNGSEKFSGEKRYGFFPSYGLGWLVSNESFWLPLKKTVNSLKLKATYGIVGNDAIAGLGGRFYYLSDIALGGGSYRWGDNLLNEYSGYSIRRYAAPEITWEISKKYNLGLEMGLFKDDAVKFQIDFFKDDRSRIYMNRENIPQSVGLETGTINGNVGRVKSQGIDGSLDVNYSFNRDAWITGRANFTYAANKYVELDEKNYADEYLKKIGYSTGQVWGYIAERLFVDEDEIFNSPRQDFGLYSAGDIKYKDVNNDGVVNGNDRVAMGYPITPEIQYGFGLSGGYKKFDASFFFQGNARVSFFIAPDKIAPFYNRRNALAIIAKDSWSESNPDIHAFWPRLSTDQVANNVQPSTWWLREGGFLRLKTVEAGYNLPGYHKIGLQSARIYFSAENLFYVSPFKLWDPEMGDSGLGYPPNRWYNIGVQLSF